MMSIEGTEQFDSTRAAILALLRAWKDEIVSFAQERLPGVSFQRRTATEIEVYPGELAVNRVDADGTQLLGTVVRDENATATLARILSRGDGRDVTLRIDSALVLRPSLRIPSASRRTLKSALVFELERVTPIEPHELYFDFLVQDRDPQTNQTDVTLRVVRRSVVDDAIRLCHGAGALVGGVAFSGDTVEGDWTQFPVDRPAFLRAQWQRFGNLALAGLALFLFFAVIVAGYQRGASANEALNDQVADAMLRAAVVERMEHRIETANTQVTHLVVQRQDRLFVQTLAAATRLFPDGTWLTELHLDGAKVRVDGYSRNASDLIGIVDKSGEFANAQFGAPLVRNPGDGTDRFELTFDVVSRGAR